MLFFCCRHAADLSNIQQVLCFLLALSRAAWYNNYTFLMNLIFKNQQIMQHIVLQFSQKRNVFKTPHDCPCGVFFIWEMIL